MHCVAIGSKNKSKSEISLSPAYVAGSCGENKKDPVPRVGLSQRAELFWHVPHSNHDGELFSGAASSFLLSSCNPFFLFHFVFFVVFFLHLFFPLSLLPLSSPLPSPFFLKKTDLGKDARGQQPNGRYGGHLGSICELCARVKYLYCAQNSEASKPTSWRLWRC